MAPLLPALVPLPLALSLTAAVAACRDSERRFVISTQLRYGLRKANRMLTVMLRVSTRAMKSLEVPSFSEITPGVVPGGGRGAEKGCRGAIRKFSCK